MAVTQFDIEDGFCRLGVQKGMMLEVHCSLSRFGYVEGGAETVIKVLKNAVGNEGAIVMPSFRLSPNQPLTDYDRELGVKVKIKILQPDEEPSAMGIVADTFRQMEDVVTGEGLFRVSAWGKDKEMHAAGFQHLIDSDGLALLLGVDIYRLSAMHYVEDSLPREIKKMFEPSDEVREVYPEKEWFVEVWEPEGKPWYTIQDKAYKEGFIVDGMIGSCKCMLLNVKKVIGLYRQALQNEPFKLYGLE